MRRNIALEKTNKQAKLSKKKIFGIRKRTLQLYSLGLIPILLVVLFSYVPMFGIIIAFKKYNYAKGIFGSPWVGLKNFEFFFKSNDFTRIVSNTLIMNALFIVTGIIAAVALALLLFKLHSRSATKVYQTILITPNFLSWVVVAYMVYALLNPNYGFLNQILAMFGKEAVDWYGEASYWPAILTVASIWKHVGMDSIMYYAALMGIDTSLFEAAKIDGATGWKITWHITIPCLIPILSVLTIMKIGGIFRADFGLFYQLPRNIGKLYETTDVVDTYIFRTMRVIGDMGTSAAVGLVQSIVGFILVIITNKVSKKLDPNTGLF